MKYRKVNCLLIVLGCVFTLSACNSVAGSAGDANLNATANADYSGTANSEGNSEEENSGNDSMTDQESDSETGAEDVDAPVIEEHFEDGIGAALERGPVTFGVTDDGLDGTKALKITDRTDSWNGANFDCNDFRGNVIRANANIKSAAKNVRISIQYDVDGITAYNWITTGTAGGENYVLLTGTYDIPADVDNIYVYVESDSTDDLYLDDFSVKAEGEYVKPGARENKTMADISEYASIKDTYKDHFDIGVCINPAVIDNSDYSELVIKEFGSVTMENDLKPESILDKEASLQNLEGKGTHLAVNMEKAKAELDFARENGMKVRGHTLIWHSQTPDWIFYVDYDTKGELADRELMLCRVDNYMKDVFTWADTEYPGMFYAWDVVNEAIEDNGRMRDSLWRQTIGDDYLEQVFAIARKYAPDYIKLFYNDYNAYQSTKQKAIIDALKPIAKAGNIDGVGMQGHLYTGESPEHFVKAASKYADELGVIMHITEIDVEQPGGVSPEGEQGKYYGELFAKLKEAKKAGVPIESVTIWGLSDSLSWKAGSRPLLFNGDLSAKQAFYEIIAAGKE